jgi:flagellar assembly protein FliH
LSRIFKSNYVKIGTPKQVKAVIPPVVKEQPPKTMEVHQAQSLEEKANRIIDEAKEMYLRIIEEANFEAQEIIRAAQDERTSMHESAMEQGYSDGYNAGFNEGLNRAEGIIQQAAELKQQLDERSATMYREAEAEMLEIVLDIARKVIGQELTQNPEVIVSLIRQALAKTAFKDKLTIRVSEADYDYVNENKNRIIMLTEGINSLDICCDKALQPGSCIVETGSGEINAGLQVQINEIQKAFEFLIRNE